MTRRAAQTRRTARWIAIAWTTVYWTAALAATLALSLALSTSASAQEPQTIQLTADDGVQTVAHWYKRVEPAPVAVLLHDPGRHSGHWRPLVQPLFRAGFQILSIDMRGHGRSQELTPAIHERMRRRENAAFLTMIHDVEAGVEWLVSEQDIEPQNICFIGGGFGSTLAIQAMARNPELGAAVALSPANTYFGARIDKLAADYGNRPLYLILPKQLLTRGAAQLQDKMRDNPHFKMKLFPRADLYGVDMLATTWLVERLIIEWLREVYELGSS